MLQRGESGRFLLRDQRKRFAGQQQIHRLTGREFLTQRFADRRRGGEREVEQEGVDGIIVVAFLEEQLEAGFQFFAGRRGVAVHRRDRAGHDLILKMDFVQVARVPHLPCQQLNLQVAITEREKIERQFGIGLPRAAVELFQPGGDDLFAAV